MVVVSKSLRRTASRSSGRGRLERTLLHAERRLVDPETAFTPELLEQTLHPDYVETGSTGNVYSREKIMEMMLTADHGGVVIRDFRAHSLAEDIAFVTYRSIGTSGQEARRTSIWVRDGESWRIRYHQGTRIPNSWGHVS